MERDSKGNKLTVTLMIDGKTVLDHFKCVNVENYRGDEIEIRYCTNRTVKDEKLLTKKIDIYNKQVRYIISSINGMDIAVIEAPRVK